MKWIWLKDSPAENVAHYVLFERKFVITKEFEKDLRHAELKIGADHRFQASLNGSLCAFDQYPDIPTAKSVNLHPVGNLLRVGENTLRVVCYHAEKDRQTSYTMTPAFAFELRVGGKVLAESDEQTLAGIHPHFHPGDELTTQLSLGYHYDFTGKEQLAPAQRVEPHFVETERPIPLLVPEKPVTPTPLLVASYRKGQGSTVGEEIATATVDFDLPREVYPSQSAYPCAKFRQKYEKNPQADGILVLLDLGKEMSGHLAFSVTVPQKCRMLLGFGEHLIDGLPRTSISGRSLALSYTLAPGKNVFSDYLFRFGARYYVLLIESDCASLDTFSVTEANYPFEKPEKHFDNPRHKQLYELGRRTLELCAHDHYEDCPWREQALYGMDSRNQMLFGYGAFGETRLPRASLKLFADTLRPDGLVELCPPSRVNFTIPVFSVFWLIAITEYAERDFDPSFLGELMSAARRVIERFSALTTDDGVRGIPGEWNFYEWSDGLDRNDFFTDRFSCKEGTECILTALLLRAVRGIAALENRLGNAEYAAKNEALAAHLEASLERFYIASEGVYASFLIDDGDAKCYTGRHVYTQAAILTAAKNLPETRKKRLLDAIKSHGCGLVPATLSVLPIVYEAILDFGDGDLDFCLEDMEKQFGPMLDLGATSLWETALGAADFYNAGSLCHGWSAVVCYLLDRANAPKNF